jgi:heme/copper-type cytochrome/quinol oxidase subunit 1
MLWALAFFTLLLERAAGRPAGRSAAKLAPALLVVGGYGFVGEWYVSGALGIPRRYAEHPPGTHVYSVVGTSFVLVFALGCAVLAAEWALLARDARRASSPAAAAEPAAVGAPAIRLPLHGGPEIALGTAACLVAVISLEPTIVKASEATAQFHHLDHAGQFLFGAVAGLTIMSAWLLGRPVSARPNAVALAVVLLAPAGMLIGMVPRLYSGLDDHPVAHLAYHVGVVAVGVATGAAAAYLGRVPGRLVVFLSIAMAAMYAGGVAGG